MVSDLLEHFSHLQRHHVTLSLVAFFSILTMGCASQAPTIAHVHIGHAITGHSSTPNNEGYFQLAEEQAQTAASFAERINPNGPSASAVKRQLDMINTALNVGAKDSFSASLQEANNHIVYAANSDDASANVRVSAMAFENSVQGVLVRAELIELYINEAKNAESIDEVGQYASEIKKLVRTNLDGEDLDNSGYIGDSSDEYGIRQLRRDLDTMIAAEDPPYRTVDRWYLFNLIRMPSGDWIFRRNKSGSSSGYQ